MFGIADDKEIWIWAFSHPYLFTLIKVSQPTLLVVVMYIGSKILFGFAGKKRR